jgi:ankyrin repeat protein
MSSLRHACITGDEERVSSILTSGTENIDAADDRLWRPLSLASKEGHLLIVRLLLDHGAEVDATGTWINYTALCVAAEYGNTDLIRLLISYGANPRIVLHFSTISPLAPLEYIHSTRGLYQSIVLVSAARGGSVPALQTLLELGANLRDINGIAGAQALNIAVEYRHKPFMEYLLDHGVSLADSYQLLNSLITAIREGNVELVQFLLDRGASINRSEYGMSAIATATFMGNRELVRCY